MFCVTATNSDCPCFIGDGSMSGGGVVITDQGWGTCRQVSLVVLLTFVCLIIRVCQVIMTFMVVVNTLTI